MSEPLPQLKDYEPIVGAAVIEEIEVLADELKGSSIIHVNATAEGGGVAEILLRLNPLMNSLGLKSDWRVLQGTDEFFDVTKSFHNACQGEEITFTKEMIQLYLDTNQENVTRLSPLDADFIIIHDPQPAAFIELDKGNDIGKWIWRCHIDLSTPSIGVWNILKPFVEQYDASLFHSARFCVPGQLVTR